MKELVKIENSLTMSSLEIAELTGKQHKNVLVDIRNMLDELKIDWAEFLAQYKDASGKTNVMYNLPKEEFLTLISSYDSNLRYKAIKEFVAKEITLTEILKSLDDFAVPEDLPDMFVYAMREHDTGHIKLGIARDPERRLKQLQTGNSSKLELLAYRKAENRFKDESSIQALFSDKRLSGEWFDIERREAVSAVGGAK